MFSWDKNVNVTGGRVVGQKRDEKRPVSPKTNETREIPKRQTRDKHKIRRGGGIGIHAQGKAGQGTTKGKRTDMACLRESVYWYFP